MKTCPKCKTNSISDDAKFCPKCGEKLQSGNSYLKFYLFLLIFSVVVGLVAGAISMTAQQREKDEFALKAPSGFVEGMEDDWVFQDYQSDATDCNHAIFYNFGWNYKWKEKYLEVEFQLKKCETTGKLSGYACYFGPNYHSSSLHKYRVQGVVKDQVWKFDTYDREGHRYDHYEGGWEKNGVTFSGICTNQKGTTNRFTFKKY